MHKILLLAGDGIGPEILVQAEKVLSIFAQEIEYERALIGGAAIDAEGMPLPEQTLKLAQQSDAVLLGAVGGNKWNQLPLAERPEKGLLEIRKGLGLYANIRPLDIWPSLIDFSPLKPEALSGVSFVIVRELTGGLYFGTPRGSDGEKGSRNKKGTRRSWNTMIYHEEEITRVAHTAFQLAGKRRGKLCSIDKANVLESMQLWREIVSETHKEYPDIDLSHMYVDNAAMQIIHRPSDFDVLLTPNLFGDILSDEAAVLSGSLGMLPSASLGQKQGLYEPIHGSAPDIAGQGKANPLGLLLSLALLFELSFQRQDLAQTLRSAVAGVLQEGYRTPDIYTEGMIRVSTDEMGSKIVDRLYS